MVPAPIAQSRPMRTSAPITALAPISVPLPISARGPITAPGSTVTPLPAARVGWTCAPAVDARGDERRRPQRVREQRARHRRRRRGRARRTISGTVSRRQIRRRAPRWSGRRRRALPRGRRRNRGLSRNARSRGPKRDRARAMPVDAPRVGAAAGSAAPVKRRDLAERETARVPQEDRLAHRPRRPCRSCGQDQNLVPPLKRKICVRSHT